MNVIQFKKKPSSTSLGGFATIAGNANSAAQVPPPAGAKAIGIDLGTTNSVVSVYSPGCQQPRTLVYEGQTLVPSMFFFDPETQSEVIGSEAKEALETTPDAVVRGTKRSMGSVAENFFSGEKQYSPEDAATLILKRLTQHPELQEEIEKNGGLWAVITVPAHFDDAARQATVEAASRAKINVLRIVNEPTAAALAYSMLPDVREVISETVAVFDFGGGTFDVSIVDREGLVFNVMSSEGDIYLGGDDIDNALAHHLLESVKPTLVARRTKEDSALFRKLLWHAEQAKIAFQTQGEFLVSDDDLDGKNSAIHADLTRDKFEEIAAPLVQRTLELTERAMHAAKRRPNQISRILLVGGSTRLHLVENMLSAYFPHCLVDARLEPDLAVSWGAAVQAAIILGIEPDTILVDVCSHTLGIGVAEDSDSINQNFKKIAKKYGILRQMSEDALREALGDKLHEFNMELQGMLRVAPIIHRNSPLPARRSEFFSTLYENQAAVHVVVVQGEGETVGEGKMLGAFLFELEQPCPLGARCEIQLTYDVNGMVHVLARQLGTENQAEAQFDSRTGEVTGWHQIPTQEEKESLLFREQETSSETNAAADEHKESAQIVSLFGMGGRSHETDGHQPTAVLNGLIARARRALEQSLEQSSKEALQHALNSYSELLAHARAGAENDAEIELAEERLLDLLDGQQTT